MASQTQKGCKMKGRWARLLRNREGPWGRAAGEERRRGRLGQGLGSHPGEGLGSFL